MTATSTTPLFATSTNDGGSLPKDGSPLLVAENLPLCSPTKSKVVLHLNTPLVIPDFSRYYGSTNQLQSFEPNYTALEDGSLLATPLVSDLAQAMLSLIVLSMVLMLFLRNMVTTGHYLFVRSRIIRVRRLFYALFGSQLLGPLGLVPTIVSYFDQKVNCTGVLALGSAAQFVSLSCLITGILGFKAYKCLNNSRVVFIVLCLFQLATTAITVLDIKHLRGDRRLSGSCTPVSSLKMTTVSVTTLFTETIFISLCFLTAVWKSRGSPVARGRISLRLSLNDRHGGAPDSAVSPTTRKRGWWDYIPNDEKQAIRNQSKSTAAATSNSVYAQLLDGFMSFFRPSKDPRIPDTSSGHKPSVLSDTSPSPRPTSKASDRQTEPPEVMELHRESPAPASLARFSLFNRSMPRMELFRKVAKDELYYTTFIGGACVLAIIFSLIGLNFKNGLSVQGWMAMNWGFISLVVIHSFGRALSRHETDATILRSAGQWSGVPRSAHLIPARFARHPHSAYSFSVSSRRFFGRSVENADDDPNNPFSDTRRLTQASISTHSSYSQTSEPEAIERRIPPPLEVPGAVAPYMDGETRHTPLPWTTTPSPATSSPVAAHYSFSVH